jgi:hypothetical protein
LAVRDHVQNVLCFVECHALPCLALPGHAAPRLATPSHA